MLAGIKLLNHNIDFIVRFAYIKKNRINKILQANDRV